MRSGAHSLDGAPKHTRQLACLVSQYILRLCATYINAK